MSQNGRVLVPGAGRRVAQRPADWDEDIHCGAGEGGQICRPASAEEVFLWKGHLGWLLLEPSWSAGVPRATKGDCYWL